MPGKYRKRSVLLENGYVKLRLELKVNRLPGFRLKKRQNQNNTMAEIALPLVQFPEDWLIVPLMAVIEGIVLTACNPAATVNKHQCMEGIAS